MKWGLLLDIIVPRFVTEDAAVISTYCGNCADEHLQPVCSMADIEPGEVYDGIITMRSFNFFGRGLWAKQVGPIRPWVNPHDKVPA